MLILVLCKMFIEFSTNSTSFFPTLPGEGLWILIFLFLSFPFLPPSFTRCHHSRLLAALGEHWTPYRLAPHAIHAGPEHHIASSRCCGAPLDPNSTPGPEHMPERMPKRMSEYASNRMSDGMPDIRWNVGIDAR